MTIGARVIPCLAMLVALPVLAADPPSASEPSPTFEAAKPTRMAMALRGPIDPERYIVGPGDVFALTVWAQTTISEQPIVTPEGNLLLPGIATVPVSGLSLEAAKARIRRSLEPQFPNVDVDVTLVALRVLEVNVVGNVRTPGAYVGNALDPASRMIALAGGFADNASHRNIEMTRRSGDRLRVDLTRYELLGDLEANPSIVDGDVIFVPFQKTEVYVEGAVERPGRFEFVPGDDLGTLIEIAGGMTRDARTDTLELQRFVDDLLTERIVVAADSAGFALPLQDGDQVLVRHRAEYRPVRTVTVRGEVRFPGPYGIVEGVDRVQDVIRAAGGITTGGSLPQARLIRTEGAEEIDLEYERLKSIPVQDMSETEYAYFKSRSRETKGTVVVDFERLVAGDDAQNVLLRPGDVIDVPQRRETVTVSGRVTYPGMITYAAGQRAAYYIAQAGGFSSQADRGETKVIQARTGEWASVNEAGVIVPGDEIWVPERPERNWWALTKDLVGFTASVAAIYLVIDQASR